MITQTWILEEQTAPSGRQSSKYLSLSALPIIRYKDVTKLLNFELYKDIGLLFG